MRAAVGRRRDSHAPATRPTGGVVFTSQNYDRRACVREVMLRIYARCCKDQLLHFVTASPSILCCPQAAQPAESGLVWCAGVSRHGREPICI